MTDKELSENAYLTGIKTGFHIAITELYKVRGNEQNYFYAYDLAQYLDRIMERSLEDHEKRYKEIMKVSTGARDE
jgi:hypothetical protein